MKLYIDFWMEERLLGWKSKASWQMLWHPFPHPQRPFRPLRPWKTPQKPQRRQRTAVVQGTSRPSPHTTLFPMGTEPQVKEEPASSSVAPSWTDRLQLGSHWKTVSFGGQLLQLRMASIQSSPIPRRPFRGVVLFWPFSAHVSARLLFNHKINLLKATDQSLESWQLQIEDLRS